MLSCRDPPFEIRASAFCDHIVLSPQFVLKISNSIHLFQIMWYMKTNPLQRNAWRSLPSDFNDFAPRDNRNLCRMISLRIIALCPLMNDLDTVWNERWDDERTLPGLFPDSCRTMLDTFPTFVRLPLRWASSRLLVNPKYGGAVMKVRLMYCLSNFRIK